MSEIKPDALSVVVERELLYPAERIWRALTESPLLAEWMMPNDFQLRVGHRFQFRAPPMPQWNGVVDCEVLVIEPGERLSYRWSVSGDDPSKALVSVVNLTLKPTSAGVMLRMEQTGFRPGQEANSRGASYGWGLFLGNLDRVLAKLAA